MNLGVELTSFGENGLSSSYVDYLILFMNQLNYKFVNKS